MSDSLIFNYHFELSLGTNSLAVDLESKASRIALQAPSGTGKTSFLRVLAGLNKKITGPPPSLLKVGYVPQDPLLIPTMTVRENLLLSPQADPQELESLAHELSIEHLLARRPRMLSGGEKQRVSIGRAILSQPKLLLMDEPFSALDRELRHSVIEVMKRYLQNKNIHLILVTHEESSVESLCEEIWTIQEGKTKKLS